MKDNSSKAAPSMPALAEAGAPRLGSPAGEALPRMLLHGSQIETWNALVSLENKDLEVAGLKVTFCRQPSLMGRSFRHSLRWIDARGTQIVLVALHAFPFSETHGASLDADSLDTLPSHLGSALESSALGLVSDRLSKVGLKARSVEASTDVPSSDSIEVVVRITGLFSGEVALRLCGTPSALVSLVKVDGLLSLVPVSPWTQALKVPVALRLEDVTLTAGEVAGLESGDVILLDGSPQRDMMLSAMRWRFGVERMAEGWIIREITMESDRLDTEAERGMLPTEARTDTATMPDPSELPVVIALELATMELPIGQLAAWSPGALVDFGLTDVSAGLPVTARIGGRQIARGDLVRIDDRFAVRLSSVGALSSPKGNGT